MEHVIATKSYSFSIRIVKLCEQLLIKKKEVFLINKLLESGTAIGSIIKSVEYVQSKIEFVSKMNIAIHTVSETEYWLLVLKDTDNLTENVFKSLQIDCIEIIKLLNSIIEIHNSKNQTLEK